MLQSTSSGLAFLNEERAEGHDRGAGVRRRRHQEAQASGGAGVRGRERRMAPPGGEAIRVAACFSVDLRGLEPLTPCMPCRCATNCATAPSGCPPKGRRRVYPCTRARPNRPQDGVDPPCDATPDDAFHVWIRHPARPSTSSASTTSRSSGSPSGSRRSGSPARTTRSSCRGRARGSTCCSGCATRPTGSPSPTTGRSARSR